MTPSAHSRTIQKDVRGRSQGHSVAELLATFTWYWRWTSGFSL